MKMRSMYIVILLVDCAYAALPMTPYTKYDQIKVSLEIQLGGCRLLIEAPPKTVEDWGKPIDCFEGFNRAAYKKLTTVLSENRVKREEVKTTTSNDLKLAIEKVSFGAMVPIQPDLFEKFVEDRLVAINGDTDDANHVLALLEIINKTVVSLANAVVKDVSYIDNSSSTPNFKDTKTITMINMGATTIKSALDQQRALMAYISTFYSTTSKEYVSRKKNIDDIQTKVRFLNDVYAQMILPRASAQYNKMKEISTVSI